MIFPWHYMTEPRYSLRYWLKKSMGKLIRQTSYGKPKVTGNFAEYVLFFIAGKKIKNVPIVAELQQSVKLSS